MTPPSLPPVGTPQWGAACLGRPGASLPTVKYARGPGYFPEGDKNNYNVGLEVRREALVQGDIVIDGGGGEIDREDGREAVLQVGNAKLDDDRTLCRVVRDRGCHRRLDLGLIALEEVIAAHAHAPRRPVGTSVRKSCGATLTA